MYYVADLDMGCNVCRHFNEQMGFVCKAYPQGIPLPILSGEVSHTIPLKGDNEIRFEPIEDLTNSNKR